MWSGKDFLRVCDELHKHGLKPNLEPGEVVARGFADLGFEEFLILPSGKLLSLMTGNSSPLAEADKERLILIPNTERIIQILESKKLFVEKLEFVNGAKWKCIYNFKDQQKETVGQSLKFMLLQLILTA